MMRMKQDPKISFHITMSGPMSFTDAKVELF